MLRSLILLGSLTFAATALGHARWKVGSKVSPPRNTSTGLKTAPCGAVARTATPVRYKPGTQITVEFEETINHTGFFEIRFLPANDAAVGMPNNLLLKVVDDQNTAVVDGVNHQFTGAITLPATKCDGCTLQLIQVMQDSVPDTYYYSCSDIQLVDDPTAPPAPVPPAPVPAPTAPAGTAKPAKPTGLMLEPKD